MDVVVVFVGVVVVVLDLGKFNVGSVVTVVPRVVVAPWESAFRALTASSQLLLLSACEYR